MRELNKLTISNAHCFAFLLRDLFCVRVDRWWGLGLDFDLNLNLSAWRNGIFKFSDDSVKTLIAKNEFNLEVKKEINFIFW